MSLRSRRRKLVQEKAECMELGDDQSCLDPFETSIPPARLLDTGLLLRTMGDVGEADC